MMTSGDGGTAGAADRSPSRAGFDEAPSAPAAGAVLFEGLGTTVHLGFLRRARRYPHACGPRRRSMSERAGTSSPPSPCPSPTGRPWSGASESDMFDGMESEGQGPPQVAPRRGGAAARAGPRRGLRGGHGHLRSTSTRCGPRSSSRCPPSASSTGWAGRASGAPATPSTTTWSARTPPAWCCGSGSAVRNWKPGDKVTVHCNYVDDQDPSAHDDSMLAVEPAHLGLRDELRRAGRPHGGQGQPAHAQADPPQLGGGGRQRPVQLDRLPHAGLAQRGPHDPGRQGAGLGGQRRARQLRRPARAQRRRDAGRGGVLAREGGAAPRPGGGGGHRPQGGRLPVLVGRAHPGRVGVAPLRQGHPRPGGRRARDRLRAPRPPDDGGLGLRLQAGRDHRHLRGHLGLHDRVRQPPPVDEAQDHQGLPLRQLPRGLGRQPADLRGQGPAAALGRLPARSRWARRPTRSTTTCTRGRSACCAWRPRRASASTTRSCGPKVGEDRITLFRRHGA